MDQPGPALSAPQGQLDAGLQCSANLPGHRAVLLVHGTGSSPEHNFGWNWEPALNSLGIPWCSVRLPGNAMDDIQTSGEYVVNAIRTMYAVSGQRIAVLGHSQGGMVPRWALRFWPDTRAMVDDQIGLAPSNHGTLGAAFVCRSGCAPSTWQQGNASEFIKALNSSQETFPGISYTEIYSHNDTTVTPNQNDSGSSSLHGGSGEITNVAVQDLCPMDSSSHGAVGTIDPVAYALGVDAIVHPGPANPARIDPAACSQTLMPGVNPATVGTEASAAQAEVARSFATFPRVGAEPALKCYVTASCPVATTVKCKAKKKKKHKHRAAVLEKKKKKHGCKKKNKKKKR